MRGVLGSLIGRKQVMLYRVALSQDGRHNHFFITE